MSTATPVPETWELTGDDARETLARHRPAPAAPRRLRTAARRRRLQPRRVRSRIAISLVLVQAIIALVGLAAALGNTERKRSHRALARRPRHPARPATSSPPTVTQAQTDGVVGALHRADASVSSAPIITGTTLMGQFERALNRLYGIEQDRPTLQKYGRALVLAVTTGVLAIVAFTALAFGRRSAKASTTTSSPTSGPIARWPLALVLMMAAMALLFRWSPRRHQPAWSWLAFGASVSVAAVGDRDTLLLGLFFRVEHVVRRHVRTARRHRRVVAVGAALVGRGALRRRGRRATRSRARRRTANRRTRRRSSTPSPTERRPHRRERPCSCDRRERPRPTSSVGRSKASSGFRRPRATASTSCATATRSFRRCSMPSPVPSTRSTS